MNEYMAIMDTRPGSRTIYSGLLFSSYFSEGIEENSFTDTPSDLPDLDKFFLPG